MSLATVTTAKAPRVPKSGVWCPAVTLFDDTTDTPDYASQAQYYDYLVGCGVSGLIVMDSNAEAFLLTREERIKLIAVARKAIGPRFPLMAGAGAASTKQTLELAQDAMRAGADYLLVLPPAYFGGAATPSVVKRFFVEVSLKCPLPIVIYNNPEVCNGVDISSDLIVEIFNESKALHPSGNSNIVGVKLMCGSVGKITRLAAALPRDEFAIYGGQSDFLVGGMTAGSDGCVAALANVFPTLISQIFSLYQNGEYEQAFHLQQVAALAESQCKNDIAAIKYAVAAYSARSAGVHDTEHRLAPRHPYLRISESDEEEIRSALREAGDIEWALRDSAKDDLRSRCFWKL